MYVCVPVITSPIFLWCNSKFFFKKHFAIEANISKATTSPKNCIFPPGFYSSLCRPPHHEHRPLFLVTFRLDYASFLDGNGSRRQAEAKKGKS